MIYPYDLYIKFLITKGLDYDKICGVITDHGGICPSEVEVQEKSKELLDKHSPLVIKDIILRNKVKIKDTVEFLQHMKLLEVSELWLLENGFCGEHKDSMKHAFDIFDNAKRRTELNCLLLNKRNSDDIEQIFMAQYNFTLRKRVLELYQKYFCNLNIMGKKDWVEYLRKENSTRKNLYLIAMNEDELRIKFELGFKTKIEYVKALDDIVATSYFKFKQNSSRNINEENEKKARAWAKMLIDAGEKREKIQTGNMQEFSEALQMEFTFDEDQFPTYADLNKETHDGPKTTDNKSGN